MSFTYSLHHTLTSYTMRNKLAIDQRARRCNLVITWKAVYLEQLQQIIWKPQILKVYLCRSPITLNNSQQFSKSCLSLKGRAFNRSRLPPELRRLWVIKSQATWPKTTSKTNLLRCLQHNHSHSAKNV